MAWIKTKSDRVLWKGVTTIALICLVGCLGVMSSAGTSHPTGAALLGAGTLVCLAAMVWWTLAQINRP